MPGNSQKTLPNSKLKRRPTKAAAIKRREPRPARINGDRTRQRLLDTAEKLFAEHGIESVSLRRITAQAGANPSAIHFHFASKEALLEEIFTRRIEPINQRRLGLLRAAITNSPGGVAPIEEVVAAFVRPHLELIREYGPGGAALMQFMARVVTEASESIAYISIRQFDDVWHEFSQAATRALPHLPAKVVYWRMFFMSGALYYITPSRIWLEKQSNGLCDVKDTDTACRQIIPFLIAGLTAPAPASGRGGRKSADASRHDDES